MDVNGDGAIAPSTEVFDLAVVANGIDGTLQFYPCRSPAIPSCFRPFGSLAPRLPTYRSMPTSGWRTSRSARAGWPLSISTVPRACSRSMWIGMAPDDRVSGQRLHQRPGSHLIRRGNRARGRRPARCDLPPAPAGAQPDPLPASNPVPNLTGDEEDILSTGRAFTTDAAVRLAISTTAAFESVHVVIGEQTEGNPSLSFGNGSATMTVPAGLAEATVHIARGAGPAHATLSVVQPDGSVLARASFTLEDPDLTPRALTRLLVAPETATLTPSSLQAQLSVGGVFNDGRTYNLTTGASGTTYQAADPSSPRSRRTAHHGARAARPTSWQRIATSRSRPPSTRR